MRYLWIGLTLGLIALLTSLLYRCTPLGDQEVRGRFRITAEVDTPEGLKVGSGVLETRVIKPAFDFRPYHVKVKGEAIPVDLGARGKLFLTLAESGYLTRGLVDNSWGPPVIWLAKQYEEAGLIPTRDEFNKKKVCWWLDPWLCEFQAVARLRQVVQGVPLPLLVRFTDLTKPETVEAVDPGNLSAAFGEGVSLRRVTMVPTEEPVTRGALSDLNWLAEERLNFPGHSLKGERVISVAPFDPLSKQLGVSRFISPALREEANHGIHN